jgi:hypothetical protein
MAIPAAFPLRIPIHTTGAEMRLAICDDALPERRLIYRATVIGTDPSQ